MLTGGAADAITKNDRSLLPPELWRRRGISASRMWFAFTGRRRTEYLGRGIINYSRDELAELIGTDCTGAAEAINRDNWGGCEGLSVKFEA